MSAFQSLVRHPYVWRYLAAFSALLVVFHSWRMCLIWTALQGGALDPVPGATKQLMLSHVSGIALAFLIPMPGAMIASATWSPGKRRVLRVVWGVLMAIAFGAVALGFAARISGA